MSIPSWSEAFAAVESSSDFGPLLALLDSVSAVPGINDPFDYQGQFLTPLVAATVLGLEDWIPRLCARGADPTVACLWDGFLCGPLHVAALRLDLGALRQLLDLLGPSNASSLLAESSTVEGEAQTGWSYVALNALHVLVLKDLWHEEVYQLLLTFGVGLSVPCQTRIGAKVFGLELPQMLGNKAATEERIDSILSSEVKFMIRHTRVADELNEFLELCSTLKRKGIHKAYRCIYDVDFDIRPTPKEGEGPDEEAPPTAMIFAACCGNVDAVRLLLYSGADLQRKMKVVIPFDDAGQEEMVLEVGAVQLALLHGQMAVVEALMLFGVPPAVACRGHLRSRSKDPTAGLDPHHQETWEGLGLIHLALLIRKAELIRKLLQRGADVDAVALRTRFGSDGGSIVDEVAPVRLAVILNYISGSSCLLDNGAAKNAIVLEEARANVNVCEMFGGPSVVDCEDWIEAFLTGESALQALVSRRTDPDRILKWPGMANFSELLRRHRLGSPELANQLAKALGDQPTVLKNVRPVHLAVLLQQPWALHLLHDAGHIDLATAPPCQEHCLADAGLPEDSPLAYQALDLVTLAVRTGGLKVLEAILDKRLGLNVNHEAELVPDFSPPFFPRRETQLAPTWAWRRLSALELALLHRRVDAAVLLVRLGANLIHTVDHVAVEPPTHYSVTDMCFRGLTPLHLCALLDLPAAAAALLNEGCQDKGHVVPDEFLRAQRQQMLSAMCIQGWATVEGDSQKEEEHWLWRDLQPLHLAILHKHYDLAALLVDLSSPETLAKLCICKGVADDSQRSFSALLLAFEHDQKELHRKIAKRAKI